MSAGQPIHSRGQASWAQGWHPARRRWRGQRGVTVPCIQSPWHDMNGCHYMNFCNAMFDAILLCYVYAWQLRAAAVVNISAFQHPNNADQSGSDHYAILLGVAKVAHRTMALIRTTNRFQLSVACWGLLSLCWQLCTNHCQLLQPVLVSCINCGTVDCPAKACTSAGTHLLWMCCAVHMHGQSSYIGNMYATCSQNYALSCSTSWVLYIHFQGCNHLSSQA